jgi:hypothetical protein
MKWAVILLIVLGVVGLTAATIGVRMNHKTFHEMCDGGYVVRERGVDERADCSWAWESCKWEDNPLLTKSLLCDSGPYFWKVNGTWGSRGLDIYWPESWEQVPYDVWEDVDEKQNAPRNYTKEDAWQRELIERSIRARII